MFTCSCSAISVLVRPSAHASTMRDRSASACAEDCRRIQRSSVSRSLVLNSILAVGRPLVGMAVLNCWLMSGRTRPLRQKFPFRQYFLSFQPDSTLGGATGSERLRDWAGGELKGYGEHDELPPYRTIAPSPLLLDGATTGGRVTGQLVPATMLPEATRVTLDRDLNFTHGVTELRQLVEMARSRGEQFVTVAPPGVELLLPLINDKLRQAERSPFGKPSALGFPPRQVRMSRVP